MCVMLQTKLFILKQLLLKDLSAFQMVIVYMDNDLKRQDIGVS